MTEIKCLINSTISIIVAVYNRESVLQRCLKSIVSQTYTNKEIIVIDAGSTDGTLCIIKKFDEYITYWGSEPDRGIYHAFNKGIKHATGDWIYFLGSDDFLWNQSVLNDFYKKVSEFNNLPRVVYGKVVLVNHNGDSLEILNKPWKKIKNLFLEGCCICHQGVFHHRNLFDVHGDFDEEFRISGVYEFLLRELKDNDALFLPDLTVAAMQTGGLSTTSHNSLEIFSEYEKARKKNNVRKELSLRLIWGDVKNYIKSLLRDKCSQTQINYIADIYRVITFRKPIWLRMK